MRYLVEGLAARGVDNALAIPRGSALSSAEGIGAVRSYQLPMRGDLDFALVPRLIRVIKDESPDIVHLHSRRGADIFGGIAARWCGVPAILSRRVDNLETAIQVRLKYPLYRKVITISEGIRKVLLSEGLATDHVVCVRSAVDMRPYLLGCDRDWFLREFALQDDAAVIAVVAQLIPRKGHRFLIEAFAALIDDFPNARLLVFGRGPEGPVIQKQISDLGLTGQVIMAGFRDDLPRILPCLNMMVLPSLKEGLGVALLQASSAGVPVVASDAGGMPEAVKDGESGLLVAPRDSGALQHAIRRLLENPSLAKRLGEGGRAMMAREFSIDAMVEGNLAVYREILECT